MKKSLKSLLIGGALFFVATASFYSEWMFRISGIRRNEINQLQMRRESLLNDLHSEASKCALANVMFVYGQRPPDKKSYHVTDPGSYRYEWGIEHISGILGCRDVNRLRLVTKPEQGYFSDNPAAFEFDYSIYNKLGVIGNQQIYWDTKYQEAVDWYYNNLDTDPKLRSLEMELYNLNK